jgi:transposase
MQVEKEGSIFLWGNRYFISLKIDGVWRNKLLSRYIMEKHLGRKLKRNELVHHIDENPLNNEISNLKIVSYKEHRNIHGRIELSKDNLEGACKKYILIKDLAEHFNISKQTIYRRLEEYNINFECKPLSGERNGMYGRKRTQEERDKISKTKIERGSSAGERKGMYGKTHTDETKKKISNIHKGKIESEETRRKKSEAHRGSKSSTYKYVPKEDILLACEKFDLIKDIAKHFNVTPETIKRKFKEYDIDFKSKQYELISAENNPMNRYNIDVSGDKNPFSGRKHSKETKEKIGKNTSKALTGRVKDKSNRYNKNITKELVTELLKIFETQKEVAKELGVSEFLISKRLRES